MSCKYLMNGKYYNNFEELLNLLNSNQIKSATGNAGTFSNTTGNIDFSIIDSQRATTNELQKLEIAKQLQEQGVSNEGIWITTGWEFDTAQKRWVQEIPTNLSIKFDIQEQTGIYNLEDVVDFPELFERFPEYKNIKVEIENDNNYGTIAYFDGRETININKNLLREANSDSSKSFNSTANRQTLSHEIQHIISSTLSFEGGITPFGIQVAIGQDKRGNRLPGKRFERISELVSNRFGEEWRQTASLEALVDFSEELYLNSAGELQAYNVQDRMLLTLEDLSTTPPSSTQRSQTPINLDLSIIGEQGATALDVTEESTHRLDNLTIAKEMESSKKSSKEIRLATSWERGADGLWRYEIADQNITDIAMNFKQKDELVFNEVSEHKLPDIYDNQELYNAYPQLKDTDIVFYKSNGTILDQQSMFKYDNKIYINANGFTTENNSKSNLSNNPTAILHEIQHLIQENEGFTRGTSQERYEQEITSRLPQIRTDIESGNPSTGLSNDIRRVTESITSSKERAEALLMSEHIGDVIPAIASVMYNSTAGEVEARNVQTRMNMFAEQRRQTLLQETEDVAREDQIFLNGGSEVFLIPNLESEAYNRREGETLEQYKDRLREEVFARMIGDNAPQYLQDLGLDKKEVKSFLQRVSEFIDFFVEWLQGKQGFKDMSRRDIEQLSVRDFLQKATTSQLLGEYSVDITSVPSQQSILL